MPASHLNRYMTAATSATPTRAATRYSTNGEAIFSWSRTAVHPKPRKKLTKFRKVYRLDPPSMFDRSAPSAELSTSMLKSLSASAPMKVMMDWMTKMREAVRVMPQRIFMAVSSPAHQVAIIVLESVFCKDRN